jgi:hypothetical protein
VERLRDAVEALAVEYEGIAYAGIAAEEQQRMRAALAGRRR